MKPSAQFRPVAPRTRIGHVHLKVSDLERSIRFYRDVLGFELTQRYGQQAAFLSAGGYHHHIGLNTWESAGGSPPPRGATGLYHVAIVYPSRKDLADALRRLMEADIPLEGASDHGVSEALYLRDPDGNGVELYWDRPEDQWPRTEEGGIAMTTQPLYFNLCWMASGPWHFIFSDEVSSLRLTKTSWSFCVPANHKPRRRQSPASKLQEMKGSVLKFQQKGGSW